MPLKIAFNAYNQDHLDGYGGLEQRFSVNWAFFLKDEGHDIHFLREGAGCDESFDLYWNAPVCSDPNRSCRNVRARKHIHNYFHFDVRPVIQYCPCAERGECFFSSPYVDTFKRMKEMEEEIGTFKALLTPIAYPDNWRPSDLVPGFDRDEIMWCNKGSLDPKFGPENAPYYPGNSVEILKALVKLNQRVDFKTTFVLNNLIRTARPEYGVEGLISQLKNVERVDQIPWSNLVARMGKCKINTHAGGLTSAINEALFVGTAPLTNTHFGFFNDICQELNIVPDPQHATSDQIYDGLEKLWLDRNWYNKVIERFETGFAYNRTEGLRKAWRDLEQTLYDA
jgi:hypothetical protein